MSTARVVRIKFVVAVAADRAELAHHQPLEHLAQAGHSTVYNVSLVSRYGEPAWSAAELTRTPNARRLGKCWSCWCH
jgi:hypothetical protein